MNSYHRISISGTGELGAMHGRAAGEGESWMTCRFLRHSCKSLQAVVGGSVLEPFGLPGKGLEVQATEFRNPQQALGERSSFKPKSGNVYVALNCTVKNVNAKPLQGESEKYISDGYWNLVDCEGKIYCDVNILAEDTPGFKLFETYFTSPGDVVNSYVFLEVPANAAFKYIYYDDGGAHLQVPL